MGLQLKSNTSRNKGSNNKSTGSSKKKNSKAKTKKNEAKASHKHEAKSPQNASDLKIKPFPSEKAFMFLFTSRLFAAFFSNISDCDETYNYWEPSHFLLFGRGFQTWEYSPEYALRSYTYILLHVAPMWICDIFIQPNRLFIFYCIRVGLGTFCAFCECYFFKAVSSEFGAHVGRMLLMFLTFSPGMFIASTAFLPSSFSMYMCFLSIGAWIKKKYELAIFSVAISTFIGWPFAALLGAPIALDMLIVKKYYKRFFQWSLISAVTVLVPLVKMDSDVYNKFVITPLNIVKYNIFSDLGPDLYGTEPICFYLINGILNFNIIFIAAILAPSCLLLRNFVVTQAKKKGEFFTSWLILSPFYIWFVVFTLQPHKEERFLFPVYPLICLCGALCINSLRIIYSVGVVHLFGKASRRLADSPVICTIAIIIAAALGISRTVSLVTGYRAPLDVWYEMQRLTFDQKALDPHVPMNICYGKEWHRFPTNFFVPSNNWSVKFIKSEFKGQLPSEYSLQENATAIVHSHFNNMNKEEPSRYFDLEECDFLIDCDYGKTSDLEPNYAAQTDKWSIMASFQFLNAEKSSVFFRSFYIPFISDSYCSYSNYYLLRSTKFQMETGKG